MEQFATSKPNIIVCKSMSKVYALSGMRVAYLCSNRNFIQRFQKTTPPWIVGLPAQIAAVYALNDSDYYQKKYIETHELRTILSDSVRVLGLGDVNESAINSLLIYLKPEFSAKKIISYCKENNVFLRDVTALGNKFEGEVIRIAVKDLVSNEKIVAVLRETITV